MSNEIIGSGKTLKNLTKTTNGQPGKLVSIDPEKIKSSVNRDTLASTLSRYLNGGFDHAKWSLPTVAHIKSIGETYTLDGDHRRHMWMLCFPGKHMDAWRVELDDMIQYHKIFTEINRYKRKNINTEECFIHEVLSLKPEALATRQDLIQCGLSVYGAPDKKHGTVGKGPRVKVSGFRKAIKLADIENVKLASELLQDAYPSDIDIRTELLGGLAVVFKVCPKLRKTNKVANEFRTWFKYESTIRQQRALLNGFKHLGGAVHKRAFESIAVGIVDGYHQVTPGAFGANGPVFKTRTNATPIAKLKALRDVDRIGK